MYIKKIILLLACLIPLAGLAQDKFEISGQLSSVASGRIIMLSYQNSKGKKVRISTTVKNKKFTLSGFTAFGNSAFLSLLPVNKDSTEEAVYSDFLTFFLEKGKYVLSGKDRIANASISGTKSQEEYLDFNRRIKKPRDAQNAFFTDLTKATEAKDTAGASRLQAELRKIRAEETAVQDSFLIANPDSYVTLEIIDKNLAGLMDSVYFDRYYKILSRRMLSTFSGKSMAERYHRAKQLAIGRRFDFSQPNEKGVVFELSTLRGKYVLIDFWASWCGPCRAETPYLIKAYEGLKHKKFEIVSISLDDNRLAWLKAVAADNMTWIQVSDLKGFKNTAAVKYGITTIPRNILIDPNGIIIAKDLRGEDVTAKLSAFLN